MASLVLLQGGQASPYEIAFDEVVVGRHPDCEIQLQSNMVSRRHARVVRDGTRHFIEDLGSGNGTFVNGKRVDEKTLLNHHDRIKLGPVLLRFEADGGRRTVEGSSALLVDLDEQESSTIMGTIGAHEGFGLLDAQPAAKLKGVLEITRSLVGTVDPQAILPRLLDTLFTIFPHADRGCILLKDPETGEMRVAAWKHRRREEGDETVRLSRTVVNKVLEEKKGLLSADAAHDEQFQASESISSLSIRSVMCVPMIGLQGEPMGLINIDAQNPLNQFKKEDLDLLMAVAGQAALSYETALLLVSHMEKEKRDSEMRIARRVQEALLPRELPHVPGYRFYASYDAAQEVGGDYYDAMLLADGKVCLSFGDVAGKGVPGALIMSRMSSVVQSTMRFTSDVAEAIAAINNHMCSNMVEGRFVTYVMVIIDPRTHEMALVNAGHPSPLIRSPDGRVEEFHEETIGIPVGIVEDYPYRVVRRTLHAGETVVITTDGVDEAMNADGELYTRERMMEFVKTARPDAAELGKALLADVRRHASGREQNDDITIMTFGREG